MTSRSRRSSRSSGPGAARSIAGPADRRPAARPRAARASRRAGGRRARRRGAAAAARGPAPARRDHHGRQPPLGAGAAASPTSRATPPASRPIRGLLQHAVRRGVPMLTLYAFSRENWARSDDEVAGLFDLLGQAIRDETDELRAQGVRVRLLGRLEELPDDDPRRRSGTPSTAPPRAPASSSTSPGTTPAGRSSWTRSGGSPPPGIPADAGRRADDQRGAVHGRPAGPGPRDPDRRRAADQQLPDLAVRLRRARVHRAACGRTSGPTRSTRRCSSSPAARAGSGASGRAGAADPRPLGARPRPGPARRAVHRAVRRSPLVLALVAGARRGWRSSGCCRAAGYPSLALFGTALAVAHRAPGGVRSPTGEKGLLLVARGRGARRASAHARGRTRATGWSAWIATVFGALYVGLIAFVLHVAAMAPAVPAGGAARAARRRARLDPAARARRVELRHRRLPRRPPDRPPQVPDPHLAVEVDRGPRRRPGRLHDRDRADARGPRPGAARRRSSSGRCSGSPPRPATSRSRCSSAPPAPRTRGR